jgi:hypothetical protein
MSKKYLVVGLLLIFLAGCGQLNLPTPVTSPDPALTSAAPQASATAPALPTEPRRTPSRETEAALAPVAQITPTLPSLPNEAPDAVRLENPLYVVQPGTPTWVANFLKPDAGCSYMGIAGQVFDTTGQPVRGLIVEVSGELEGNSVLHLVLSGGSTLLGPGGYEIQIADRAIASQGTLTIQIFDLAGLALSDQIAFDTSAACDANQIVLNFTATKIDYSETLYFPYMPND